MTLDKLYKNQTNVLSGIVKLGYIQPWYNNNKMYLLCNTDIHTLLPHKNNLVWQYQSKFVDDSHTISVAWVD